MSVLQQPSSSSMNLQSYGFLQRSTELIDVQQFPSAEVFSRAGTPTAIINVHNHNHHHHHQVVDPTAMVTVTQGTTRNDKKPPINQKIITADSSTTVKPVVKLQRRSSGRMTRPLGLLQQKSNESIKLTKIDSGNATLQPNPVRKNSSGSVSSLNQATYPMIREGSTGNRLQRSESVIIQRLTFTGNEQPVSLPGTPLQKNRVRRHASMNSPRTRNYSNTDNLQSLAIDNTSVNTPQYQQQQQQQTLIRQSSDLQPSNPYKKLVPKPHLSLKPQLFNQGANSNINTASFANFTQSIELFNSENNNAVPSLTLPSSKSTADMGGNSKGIDPVFTNSKDLNLISQSAIVGGTEEAGAKETSAQLTDYNIAATSSNSHHVQGTYSDVNFLRSMDTIRLSTVNFDGNYENNEFLTSHSTIGESSPQLSEGEPKRTVGRRHRVVQSLSVGPKTLHRRGISNRDHLESHPLPDQIDEVASHVTGFTRYSINDDGVSNSADQQYSIPTAAVSGRSSPSRGTESDTTQSWTETTGEGTEGWFHGGGNTTERSSEFSLEDEFDRNSALKVRLLFEEIDSMLFERINSDNKPAKPHPLQGECKEWVSQFPHVRILGHQMLAPQDHGFVVIPGDDSQPYNSGGLLEITEQDIAQTHAIHELQVSGQHVRAKQPSMHSLRSSRDAEGSGGEHSGCMEETFAEDGHIEEIMAVDFTSTDEDVKSSYTRRRGQRQGLPPMTPQACIKDNLHGAIFDFIWTEFISWLRPVNNKFVQNSITDSIISAADDLRVGVGGLGHHTQYTSTSTALIEPIGIAEDDEDASTPRQRGVGGMGVLGGGIGPLALDPTFASGTDFMILHSTSREASNLSTGRDKLVRNVASSTQLGGQIKQEPTKKPEVSGILQVSSKTMHSREREKSVLLQDSSTDYFGSLVVRPNSSKTKLLQLVGQQRPSSVKPADIGPRNASAQARTRSSHFRLQPLVDKSKTSNAEDDKRLQHEVLQGHRISTPSDYIPSIPTLLRNGTLPPLNTTLEREISDTNFRQVKTAGSPSQRASSAVHHDKENRASFGTFREHSFKEKTFVPPVQLDNRPSTTQAFRSDSTTPFNGGGGRRSQTPMAQNPMGPRLHQTSGLGHIPQGVVGMSGSGTLIGGFTGGGGASVGGAPPISSNMQITGNSITNLTGDGQAELEDTENYDDYIHSATQWDYRRLVNSTSYLSRSYEPQGATTGNSQMRRTARPLGNTAVR